MLHLTIALLWCWANRIADQTPICYLVFLMCKMNTEACCSAIFKRSDRDLKINLERKRGGGSTHQKSPFRKKSEHRFVAWHESIGAQRCCIVLRRVSFCWQKTYTSALFSFPQGLLHHVFFFFYFLFLGLGWRRGGFRTGESGKLLLINKVFSGRLTLLLWCWGCEL